MYCLLFYHIEIIVKKIFANLNGILHSTEKTILKFILKHVRSQIAKAILSTKNDAGGDFWLCYRTITTNQHGNNAKQMCSSLQ